MKILKHIITLPVILLTLAACHDGYAGPLYEYKIVCQDQPEPLMITETKNQYVNYSLYASGYLIVTIRRRHDNLDLEVHEWPDQSFCSVQNDMPNALQRRARFRDTSRQPARQLHPSYS